MVEETPRPVFIKTQIYVTPDQWARFQAYADANHRSRSAQIRELIDRALEQAERP